MPARRSELPRRRCLGDCGLLFRPRTARQRFCTAPCYKAWYHATVNARPARYLMDGDEYAELVALRRAGLGYGEIAGRYGLSIGHVWRIVNRAMGVYLPTVERCCGWCGQAFQGRADARYCRSSCRTAAANRRVRDRARFGVGAAQIEAALVRAIARRVRWSETGVWSG
jgi:hypothetical protein